MKAVVIDFQAFKSNNNEFILKELASYNGTQSLHCVFQPPFEFHKLSIDSQKQANWLANRHHHLNWTDGYVPLEKFQEILEVIVSEAEQVFVKGREKAKFIEKYLQHHQHLKVCEIAEQPALTSQAPSCLFHQHLPTYCALTNVYYLHSRL